MAFSFRVNGEFFALQTEVIVDDLSEERVSKTDIEALAKMLAERFIILNIDTILLQGLSNTLMLAILLAAWRVGKKVALMRADMPEMHFAKATEKLGNTLHIYYDGATDAIYSRINAATLLFEDWLMQASVSSLQDEPYHWDDETTALIFFTSGSTGTPKGVCHSLASLIRSAQTFKKHYAIKPQDKIVSFAELHTNTGLRTLALTLLGEARVVFIRKHKGTQSHELLALKNASFMISGPYMIEVLLNLQGEFKALLNPNMKILSLGSYLPPATVELMYKAYGISVLNFYGLTETFGFALADTHRNLDDLLPPPCEDVKQILLPVQDDPDLYMLAIESPNLFLGYLGEPLARKAQFNTKDLVLRKENGYLKFMGRASGAAKAKNGEWIFPLHLETWLRGQADIKDAVVQLNPPLTSHFLLTAFITTIEPFSALSEKLMQDVIENFGHDYHSIEWQKADIKRSVEGKVEKITKVTKKGQFSHA